MPMPFMNMNEIDMPLMMNEIDANAIHIHVFPSAAGRQLLLKTLSVRWRWRA